MKPPQDLISDLMRRARQTLYKGRPDKQWFSQQDTVKKALTFTAAELKKLEVSIPSQRYEEIVGGILAKISRHGDIGKVQYPGAYLLHAVQQHWLHHGHEYYEEGKAIRTRVGVFFSALERATAEGKPIDHTVDVLAEVHATLALGKRRAKVKAVAAPLQADLFGAATPRK